MEETFHLVKAAKSIKYLQITLARNIQAQVCTLKTTIMPLRDTKEAVNK